MKDLSMAIRCTDEKLILDGGNSISLEDASVICGAFQSMLAYKLYTKGMNEEDVRNYLLDLHLGAMEDFMMAVRKGGQDDKERNKVESQAEKGNAGKGTPSAK